LAINIAILLILYNFFSQDDGEKSIEQSIIIQGSKYWQIAPLGQKGTNTSAKFKEWAKFRAVYTLI